MILLITRRKKATLEKYLDISKKMYDSFEDVDRLEGKLGSSKKRQPKPGRMDIITRQRHRRSLQI